MGRSIFVGLAVSSVIVGCADDSREGIAKPERTVVGDTTVVRWTEGTSGDLTLIEEVKIGALNGPEEYLFGIVNNIAIDAEGGIYVFDRAGPALRYYDASGEYLRTLGAEGQGPGEYRDPPAGLAVRSTDGRIVLRDPESMRMNVYNPDGSLSDTWREDRGSYTSNRLTLDQDDHMYVSILTGPIERDEPTPVGLLHFDATGQPVDTIVPPHMPNEPGKSSGVFSVSKEWDVSPLGGLVVGVSNQYSFEHRKRDGTVLRIERDVPLAVVFPDERREIEDFYAWRRRTGLDARASDLPPIPRVKPAFRSIRVGEHGRIWVRRYAESEKRESAPLPTPSGVDEPPPAITWQEPTIMDVFEPDGTFLGSVRVPDRVDLRVYRGDQVWGVRRGDFDESYVVGFRLSES